MEAVKLESMHAPEHAMSSLVVAQVPRCHFGHLCQGHQGARLFYLSIQGSTEAIQQVAQEAQNVREAEGTVLPSTTG